MNGIDLASTLRLPASGLHYLDETDGRASVVAGYTTGRSSLLVQGPILYRPPGSSIWLVRVDPRRAADGPSYMIDASVAARFVPLTVPPVPGLEDRLREDLNAAATFTRTQLDLNEADTKYWKSAAVTDFKEELGAAPGRLATFYGNVAGGAIRTVSSIAGGAAGAFYGALPFWLQVGIPAVVALAGVAGAAAIVRRVPSFTPGA